jgi:hypothetical protein
VDSIHDILGKHYSIHRPQAHKTVCTCSWFLIVEWYGMTCVFMNKFHAVYCCLR